MPEHSLSQSDTSLLDRLTLALVVSSLGVYTDEAVSDLRRYVSSKGSDAHIDGSRCMAGASEETLCERKTPTSFSVTVSPASNEDGSKPTWTHCSMRLSASVVGFHLQPVKGPASKRRSRCCAWATVVNSLPSSFTIESGKCVEFCSTSGSGQDLARRRRNGPTIPIRSHP